ncbi:MAG: hypothetical protein IJU42_06850 [Erysipelotrichaceae bacterium]|nr:hypothetical protein [Erysipelotrichaceae bacterium]
MKMTVIVNLWTMIIAWCLYLNGYTLVALLVSGMAAVIVLMMIGEVNYKRMVFTAVALYAFLFGLYITSSIPYYFSALHIFFSIQILDASIVGEYLYQADRDFVQAILSVCAVSMAVIFVVILMVNDADYSLFTKNNLFLMESFIFLPYFQSCICPLAYRALRPVHHRKGAV